MEHKGTLVLGAFLQDCHVLSSWKVGQMQGCTFLQIFQAILLLVSSISLSLSLSLVSLFVIKS